MALPKVNIAATKPYDISLSFQGIGAYTIVEYAPDVSGGWKKSKVIQPAGHSADPQHDDYELTPVAVGEERLVVAEANMSSATGDATVSMKGVFKQGNATVHTAEDSGQDDGTSLVFVKIRTVFVGS